MSMTAPLEPGIESGARAGGESGATWFLKIAPAGLRQTLRSLSYLMIWLTGLVSPFSVVFRLCLRR
jgi:hypothetical protein